MDLTELISTVRDGEDHGWATEIDWLWEHHADRLAELAESVMEAGIQKAVLLGDDGRLWNGHHRVAVAVALCLDEVPTTYWADDYDELTPVRLVPAPRDDSEYW